MAGGTAEILLPAMSDEIVESWHFGFRPAASIGLGAMCRGRPSDHIMARLACEFLSKHESVLLFHGLLSPTLEANGWRSLSRCPPAEQAMQFMKEVGTLGGLLLAVPIEDEPSYHAVNLAFLERWISHAAFHFVN